MYVVIFLEILLITRVFTIVENIKTYLSKIRGLKMSLPTFLIFSLTCYLSFLPSLFTINSRSSFLRFVISLALWSPHLRLLFSFVPSPSSCFDSFHTILTSLFGTLLTHSLDQVNVNLRRGRFMLHDRFLNQSRRHQRIEHFSRRFHSVNVRYFTYAFVLLSRDPEADNPQKSTVESQSFKRRHSAGIYQI